MRNVLKYVKIYKIRKKNCKSTHLFSKIWLFEWILGNSWEITRME